MSFAPTPRTRRFGLPATANAGDILVNEILFNPRPTGVDFVEIVNASDRFINIKNFYVSNMEAGQPKNIRKISMLDFLLEPGAYLVLTEDAEILKGEYPLMHEANALGRG